MAWDLCSGATIRWGTAVIVDLAGDGDPVWPWGEVFTFVCTAVKARGEPILREDPKVWYGEVALLELVSCLVTEPIRLMVAGDVDRWAVRGEPALWAGNVEDKYTVELLDRGSVNTGEPQALPSEVLRDPLEGDTPVPYDGDCVLDGTELTLLIALFVVTATFIGPCLTKDDTKLLIVLKNITDNSMHNTAAQNYVFPIK